MTFKTFLIGMFASFGLAWTCIIAIPVASMGARTPVRMDAEDEDSPYYQHGVSGRILNGAEIYQNNGCYTCHTQLVRPTYAGSQIFRKDVAGVVNDDGDTRRETNYDDYAGENYAQVGLMRMGPDLSNFAYRAEAKGKKVGMTSEQWILEHLYNPRNNEIHLGNNGEKLEMSWSNCPSQPQMFKQVESAGQEGGFTISGADDGQVILPKEAARVLASYLLSFKRDGQLPASLNHGPQEEE